MKSSYIPPGWSEAPISDLCHLINGRAFKPTEWAKSGLPIVRIQNLNEPDSSFNYCDKEVEEKFIIDAGELLFAWSGTPGTSFGAHIWKGPRAVLNQHIFRVHIEERHLNKEFFRLALNQRLNTFIEKAHGGVGLGHITKGKFEDTTLYIPPLNEQRRIVAKLESLLARSHRAKEALDAIPTLLERFRQSVLAAAFRGDLTADWRAKHPDIEPASKLLERIRAERRRNWEEAELKKMQSKGKAPRDDAWKDKYEEPSTPDTRLLPEIPQGWSWVRLPELGEVARGKSKHRPRNDPRLFDGPYPFIQTGDVAQSNGRIDSASQSYSELGLAQSRLFPKGTVCITIAANIADTAVLGIDACFPDSVVGVITESRLVSPEYLELFIRTIKSDLADFAPATAQKNINLEVLSEVAIPIPPPEERVEIEGLLNSALGHINALERTHTYAVRMMSSLESSMLSKAFRGELVPQDPNDEPASVLLERIRAEREATASSVPKRSRGRRPAA
ncbi:restriction endonuclease subunit S [Archangium lipolyticum]|uniref:restriction endonuclease subunit S n=1 Tax=Archangium lipolyticum TaxID=2970465 RepID=UPI00214A03E4|nr:restriction endonuclease subunit S [Archangium lipolyticum]